MASGSNNYLGFITRSQETCRLAECKTAFKSCFLHCKLRLYSAGVESSGNGQAAALVNGARWVAGMPAQRVPVKNIRLSLNHDESGVRP